MEKREGRITRETRETKITVGIVLDGDGGADVATSIPFLDHMFNLLAKHASFDLKIKSTGDREVDDHHLVEDLGICLGEALRQALGNKEGIARYGEALLPMDECLCSVALDLSGRPYLIFNADFAGERVGLFEVSLLKEFFKAFSDHGGVTLHINLLYGVNSHHKAEAIFKGFARALGQAVKRKEGQKGVLSTKGIL